MIDSYGTMGGGCLGDGTSVSVTFAASIVLCVDFLRETNMLKTLTIVHFGIHHK